MPNCLLLLAISMGAWTISILISHQQGQTEKLLNINECDINTVKSIEQIKAEIDNKYLEYYKIIMTSYFKALVHGNTHVILELNKKLKALDENYESSIIALKEE